MKNTVRLVLARGNGFGSKLIRLFTWSKWSHIGIIIDGDVIEATGKGGVVRTPFSKFVSRYEKIEMCDWPVQSKYQVEKWVKEQVGKKYDWLWIIGLVFRRRLQRKNRWVCSELIAEALLLDKSLPFNHYVMNRITPEHFWMVWPNKKQFTNNRD